MDKDIPYIAFEAEMARHERTIKRLLVALIAVIILLFAADSEHRLQIAGNYIQAFMR